MVLSGESLFGDNKPSVDDDGFMSTVSSGNLATVSIIAGDATGGSNPGMFDSDLATYLELRINTPTTTTKYITFDMLKRKNNIILQAYYNIKTTSGATSAVFKIETSFDGSSWTEQKSNSSSGTSNTNINASLNFNARHIRFVVDPGGTNDGEITIRIYNLRVFKVVSE